MACEQLFTAVKKCPSNRGIPIIQRCQIHKARNITDRWLPKHPAAVRRALKQAWALNVAEKAERLIRNLARRFAQEAPDVSRLILEGRDGILTLIRLGLPPELRRSLASRNIIGSMNRVIRQVCRNVKRWRHAKMALRRTAAGMFEAKKDFRRKCAVDPANRICDCG